MTSPAVKLLASTTPTGGGGGGTWDTAQTVMVHQPGTAVGTTLVATSTATAAVDDIIIVRAAWDNDATPGTPTGSVTDSVGNTYTKLASGEALPGSADGGVIVEIFGTVVTSAIAVSDTFTLTGSAALGSVVMFVDKFTGGTTITQSRSAISVDAGTGTAVSSGSMSGHAAGDLILCVAGNDNRNNSDPTYDSDTLEGSWSTGYYMRAGAGGSADMVLATQHKVATGTSAQTWDITWLVGGNTAIVSVALTP